MALQRSNPVPPGVYWVDVPGPPKFKRAGRTSGTVPLTKRQKFIAWRSKHTDAVKFLKVKEEPDIAWFLFEVSSPVPWEGPGLPTFGDKDTKQTDTIQSPDPEPEGLEALTQAVDTTAKAVARSARYIGLGAFALGVLWVLRSTTKGKK